MDVAVSVSHKSAKRLQLVCQKTDKQRVTSDTMTLCDLAG